MKDKQLKAENTFNSRVVDINGPRVLFCVEAWGGEV